ncbi:MAG: hypothetical protein Q7L55_09565 [Actinomycetota bacterium]|nr:hypothetical protein [Actinomycetota bacterium]
MFRRGARSARSVKQVVRWTDLRLWLGLGLVIGSMFAGAFVLSSGEQSVTIWRAATDLAVGDVPQVEAISVRLDDSAAAYLPATSIPEGRMRVPVTAGALLPAAAVGAAEPTTGRLVTVPVDSLHSPVGLAPGDVVDVWATTDDTSNPAPPSLVLAQAHVQAVDRENIGVGGEVPVVLEVASNQAASIIAAARGQISLVEVPLPAQFSESVARS